MGKVEGLKELFRPHDLDLPEGVLIDVLVDAPTENTTARKLEDNPHQPTGTWIREKRRREIYRRDGFKCQKCGKDLRNVPAEQRTLDHIRRGGGNQSSNLRLLCKDCNSRRHATRNYLDTWIQSFSDGSTESP